jgi:2-polyprenyl-3-methyl-5-hydroxy-6-metoxy-1,4-benzoquinol methylase
VVDLVHQYHDLVRQDIFPFIASHAGKVLDVGGGVGATSAALKVRGQAERVVLIDRVADRVVAGVDEAFAGDLEDPELIRRVLASSGPFNTILCLDVLEHLRDPWSMMSELHKGLAPGGSVIISLPNINHLDVIWELIFSGRFEYAENGIMDRTHLRWFTRRSAISLATGSGLKLEELGANINERRYRILDRASLGVFTRFFATQFVMRVSASLPPS